MDHKLEPAAWASGAAGQPVSQDLEKLPFAWIEERTSLKEDFDRLVSAAQAASAHIQNQFKLPLSLVIIDTLNAAANFKDGNDAAEGQFIMNRLEVLSRRTGAFVLAVDHFGKAVETGTRGTSAKEAASDAVLAFLADRDTAGNVKSLRMTVRKLRSGATGAEIPFELSVVDMGDGEAPALLNGAQVKASSRQCSRKTSGRSHCGCSGPRWQRHSPTTAPYIAPLALWGRRYGRCLSIRFARNSRTDTQASQPPN